MLLTKQISKTVIKKLISDFIGRVKWPRQVNNKRMSEDKEFCTERKCNILPSRRKILEMFTKCVPNTKG